MEEEYILTERKFFFWKKSPKALEKNSLREEHILLTLFTNTTLCLDNLEVPFEWKGQKQHFPLFEQCLKQGFLRMTSLWKKNFFFFSKQQLPRSPFAREGQAGAGAVWLSQGGAGATLLERDGLGRATTSLPQPARPDCPPVPWRWTSKQTTSRDQDRNQAQNQQQVLTP